MSTYLSELLGYDSRSFRQYVQRLEHATLHPGVDVRLTAEIITQLRNKVRQLDLDANDTTPKELYFGLRHRLADHDGKLIKALQLKSQKVENNTAIIAQKCSLLSHKDVSLSMAPSGVKRILRAVPPKRTLKLLKFRSIESVLKRHDPRMVYAVASALENDSWHAQVYAHMKRLNAKDILWQPVECVPVPVGWHEKLQHMLSNRGALIVNAEAGVVCILPVLDIKKTGSSVLLFGLAAQAVTHIATQSIPYRWQAMAVGYTNLLPKIALMEHPELIAIHGLSPDWHTVHQLFGTGVVSLKETMSEIEVADIHWESTETKLAHIVPEMDFWVGTHFLGANVKRSAPVSLHVLDVAIAVISDAEYGNQPSGHLRASVWNELHVRYLSEDILSRSLQHQLSEIAGV